MRIALTGSSGILGEGLIARSERAGHKITPVSRVQLQADPKALRSYLGSAEVVIHAAANTNVEACEIDPSACYRDNLLLTERLAEVCLLAGQKLVFISSTGVYGPQKEGPYAEYEAADPPTHHHRSKYLAESAVLAFSRRNLVLRTGWLFGGDPQKPKNFVARRLEEANEALKVGRRELAANPLQRGNPTFTEDLADRLFEALARGESGVFNAVNSGRASRLEYVQAILEAAGVPLRVVPAQDDTKFKRVARVSPNECALNWRFEALGYGQMPEWRHSLNGYIASLGALR